MFTRRGSDAMSIRDIIFGRNPALNADEDRPPKMVQERENVWRIVYAD